MVFIPSFETPVTILFCSFSYNCIRISEPHFDESIDGPLPITLEIAQQQ